MLYRRQCDFPGCAAQPVNVEFEVFVYTANHPDPRGGSKCEGQLMLAWQPRRNLTTNAMMCHLCGAHDARYDFARNEVHARAVCPHHP